MACAYKKALRTRRVMSTSSCESRNCLRSLRFPYFNYNKASDAEDRCRQLLGPVEGEDSTHTAALLQIPDALQKVNAIDVADTPHRKLLQFLPLPGMFGAEQDGSYSRLPPLLPMFPVLPSLAASFSINPAYPDRSQKANPAASQVPRPFDPIDNGNAATSDSSRAPQNALASTQAAPEQHNSEQLAEVGAGLGQDRTSLPIPAGSSEGAREGGFDTRLPGMLANAMKLAEEAKNLYGTAAALTQQAIPNGLPLPDSASQNEAELSEVAEQEVGGSEDQQFTAEEFELLDSEGVRDGLAVEEPELLDPEELAGQALKASLQVVGAVSEAKRNSPDPAPEARDNLQLAQGALIAADQLMQQTVADDSTVDEVGSLEASSLPPTEGEPAQGVFATVNELVEEQAEADNFDFKQTTVASLPIVASIPTVPAEAQPASSQAEAQPVEDVKKAINAAEEMVRAAAAQRAEDKQLSLSFLQDSEGTAKPLTAQTQAEVDHAETDTSVIPVPEKVGSRASMGGAPEIADEGLEEQHESEGRGVSPQITNEAHVPVASDPQAVLMASTQTPSAEKSAQGVFATVDELVKEEADMDDFSLKKTNVVSLPKSHTEAQPATPNAESQSASPQAGAQPSEEVKEAIIAAEEIVRTAAAQRAENMPSSLSFLQESTGMTNAKPAMPQIHAEVSVVPIPEGMSSERPMAAVPEAADQDLEQQASEIGEDSKRDADDKFAATPASAPDTGVILIEPLASDMQRKVLARVSDFIGPVEAASPMVTFDDVFADFQPEQIVTIDMAAMEKAAAAVQEAASDAARPGASANFSSTSNDTEPEASLAGAATVATSSNTIPAAISVQEKEDKWESVNSEGDAELQEQGGIQSATKFENGDKTESEETPHAGNASEEGAKVQGMDEGVGALEEAALTMGEAGEKLRSGGEQGIMRGGDAAIVDVGTELQDGQGEETRETFFSSENNGDTLAGEQAEGESTRHGNSEEQEQRGDATAGEEGPEKPQNEAESSGIDFGSMEDTEPSAGSLEEQAMQNEDATRVAAAIISRVRDAEQKSAVYRAPGGQLPADLQEEEEEELSLPRDSSGSNSDAAGAEAPEADAALQNDGTLIQQVAHQAKGDPSEDEENKPAAANEESQELFRQWLIAEEAEKAGMENGSRNAHETPAPADFQLMENERSFAADRASKQLPYRVDEPLPAESTLDDQGGKDIATNDISSLMDNQQRDKAAQEGEQDQKSDDTKRLSDGNQHSQRELYTPEEEVEHPPKSAMRDTPGPYEALEKGPTKSTKLSNADLDKMLEEKRQESTQPPAPSPEAIDYMATHKGRMTKIERAAEILEDAAETDDTRVDEALARQANQKAAKASATQEKSVNLAEDWSEAIRHQQSESQRPVEQANPLGISEEEETETDARKPIEEVVEKEGDWNTADKNESEAEGDASGEEPKVEDFANDTAHGEGNKHQAAEKTLIGFRIRDEAVAEDSEPDQQADLEESADFSVDGYRNLFPESKDTASDPEAEAAEVIELAKESAQAAEADASRGSG